MYFERCQGGEVRDTGFWILYFPGHTNDRSGRRESVRIRKRRRGWREGEDNRTIGTIRTATWGTGANERDRKKHREQKESYLARKGNHDFRLNAQMDDALGSRNFLIGGGPLRC